MGQSNLSREGIWESQRCHQCLTVRSKRRNCVLGIVPEISASRIPCQLGTTQSKTSLDYQGESVSQNQKTSRAKRKERPLASRETGFFVKGWAHSSCWDDHRWGNGSRSSDNPKEEKHGAGHSAAIYNAQGRQTRCVYAVSSPLPSAHCVSFLLRARVCGTDTLPRRADHRAQALIHNGPLPTGLLNPGTNGHTGSS